MADDEELIDDVEDIEEDLEDLEEVPVDLDDDVVDLDVDDDLPVDEIDLETEDVVVDDAEDEDAPVPVKAKRDDEEGDDDEDEEDDPDDVEADLDREADTAVHLDAELDRATDEARGGPCPPRRVVLDAGEVVVQHLAEQRLVRVGVREQGHRRAELLRVDRPHDLHRVVDVEVGERTGALDQPRPEHRVGHVGAGLAEVRQGEPLRHAAAAEPGELREHEPHPVRALLPLPQLGERLVVGLGLGVEEPLEVEGIAHPRSI